jgi:hypothetical protein
VTSSELVVGIAGLTFTVASFFWCHGRPESIYRRYAIVDEAMHREAAEMLEAWSADQRTKVLAEATRKGQVKQFAAKS